MYPSRRHILILVLVLALTTTGLGMLETQPAAARQQVIWIAEFFDNDSLIGAPIGIASFGELGVDWGTSAPIYGMPDDHYSVRFTTDVYLTAGTYRFYVMADDAVRLWIDYPASPQMDTFGSPRPGQMLTVDVTLNTGYHHFQLDFRENVGLSYVFMKWADLATNPYPPTFPVQQAPTSSPTWRADYYANANLEGAPVISRTEDWPSHNWGSGSPDPKLKNDNFSARYTNTQQYAPGTYDISVRADDGVRVYVDGELRINEFHTATWGLYSTRLVSTGGVHTIVIEYYEGTELAALEYYFAPATPDQPASPTGATATVFAPRLNVRANPVVASNNVLTVLSSGDTYPVIGRSADNGWWQIQLQGQPGWVSAAWVTVQNVGSVPVTNGQTPVTPPPPAATGPTLRAVVNVNIRSGPGITHQDIGTLRYGSSATIIGRTADTRWWQINYQGITGWVIDLYVDLAPGVSVTQIPITG